MSTRLLSLAGSDPSLCSGVGIRSRPPKHPNTQSRFPPLTDHSLALPSLPCCIFLHLYCVFPPYPNIAHNVSRRIFYRNCRRRRRSRSFSTSGCKCICPQRSTGIFLLPPYHRRTALQRAGAGKVGWRRNRRGVPRRRFPPVRPRGRGQVAGHRVALAAHPGRGRLCPAPDVSGRRVLGRWWRDQWRCGRRVIAARGSRRHGCAALAGTSR